MVRRVDRTLTGDFWAAIDQRQLVRPVCASCQRNFFSPQVVCPSCQSADWSYESSGGEGRIYSHTTIHRPPTPDLAAPYVVADVELVEGWRMFAWIVNCPPTDVHIDQQVQVCFVDGPDGELLPAFEPVASS